MPDAEERQSLADSPCWTEALAEARRRFPGIEDRYWDEIAAWSLWPARAPTWMLLRDLAAVAQASAERGEPGTPAEAPEP